MVSLAAMLSAAAVPAAVLRRRRPVRPVEADDLAILSHELRGPLTAMIGWLDIGQGARDEKELRRAIAVALRNARQQARLVDDLLDASRIMSGKFSMHPGPVDLAQVVHEACEGCRPAAAAQGVQLWCDAPEPVDVEGDAQRLEQMLCNLIGNAIGFSQAGGLVRVTAWGAGEQACLAVEDDGAGIDAEDLPRIFGAFWQGQGQSRPGHLGLGLGLAIVRHIVELHGGRIAVRSGGLGRGTRFSIELPGIGRAPGRPAAGARVGLVAVPERG